MYAIETITTVAYGEYYPVTPLGKVISSILMLAAIGIVWTVVGIVGSNMVAKRIKQTQTSLLDETKSLIKNRIDEVEKLTDDEIETLIAMIRSLNNRKSSLLEEYGWIRKISYKTYAIWYTFQIVIRFVIHV